MRDASFSAFEQQQNPQAKSTDLGLPQDKDCVMEQILENIQSTPLGTVLRRIASLPEVRQEKVLQVRRQITLGRYDLTDRLDQALEKVLEDLTA